MKKICSYILYPTLALLLFFSVGGSTIARASTCSTYDVTVTNANVGGNGDTKNINGEYTKGADISGYSAWYKDGTTNKVFFDSGYPGYAITDNDFSYYTVKDFGNSPTNPIGDYTGGGTATVASTTCDSTPPPATVHFSNEPTVLEVLASVTSVTKPVLQGFMPYALMVMGLLVGYLIIKWIVSLANVKHKEESYEQLIERSEKDIAETERLLKETTH